MVVKTSAFTFQKVEQTIDKQLTTKKGEEFKVMSLGLVIPKRLQANGTGRERNISYPASESVLTLPARQGRL